MFDGWLPHIKRDIGLMTYIKTFKKSFPQLINNNYFPSES